MESFKTLFLQNYWANFNQTWHKSSLRVCSNEGDSPSSTGDINRERVKVHRKFSNFLFSRPSRPNSIKLTTDYSWMKGIQVCSNKGPLQTGDNHKNGKMGWGHLKILFSRTTGPILTRLGTNHPGGWDSSLFK
jgi:hypothetical protein